jgi:hypothetical protein
MIRGACAPHQGKIKARACLPWSCCSPARACLPANTLTLGGHARLHFGNEVLPDFCAPLCNEVLPDFSKASAAPFLPLSLHFDNEVLPDFPKLTEQ